MTLRDEYDYYTGQEADNMTPSGSVVLRKGGTLKDIRWEEFDPEECNRFGCKEKRGEGFYCPPHQKDFDERI